MRRPLRVLAVVLLVVAALVVAARLALDPLATWRTRRMLSGLEGMDARFASVTVRVRDLSCEIRGLRIEQRAAEGRPRPFFEARSVRLSLRWRELLHRRLAGRMDLDRPTLSLVEAGPKEASAGSQPPNPRAAVAGRDAELSPSLGPKLSRLGPFRLELVRVRRGEVRWIDARAPGKPSLRLHAIEATIENIASPPALARAGRTVIEARGTVQETGRGRLSVTADPHAGKLTFSGAWHVTGLALRDLTPLLAAQNDVVPDEGTVDLSMHFRAVEGALHGGVRPALHGVRTRPARPGPAPALKSFLADSSVNVFKDDAAGRRAAGATIPIEGTVDDPRLALLPTVIAVARNAFARGLSDALRGVPPPEAKPPRGASEQARRAPGGRADRDGSGSSR